MDNVDVVILGGGVAGLTLALELSAKRPGTTITIVERSPVPAPEATHKVGESTVEIAAHYLRDVLGMDEHLNGAQLAKFGLRVFYSQADNTDITQRPELGHAVQPPEGVGTFQVDRGRLENAMREQLGAIDTVSFLAETRVVKVELDPTELHHVTLTGAHSGSVSARWVVDSTGRSSLLKRQLGLTKESSHHANAAWFRFAGDVDVDTWSTDPNWHARIRESRRGLSTNHLMGPGYWVWLIPLASGATSVGIVTDAKMYPFASISSAPAARAWLQEHEPQCADHLDDHDQLDFRVMSDYSYSADQVFSGQRWCLTGDAGVFLDPLYSPGLDLIAMSNSLICDLVVRELSGEDIEELAIVHNQVFMLVVDGWAKIYTGQYPVMASPRAMTAKIVWDTAAYWAVPGLLFFQDHLRRILEQPRLLTAMARFSWASEHTQRLFREWAQLDLETSSDTDLFVSLYDFDFMPGLHSGMTAQLSGDELGQQVNDNVDLIEDLSGQLAATLIDECQALGGAAAEQARLWARDPELAALRERYESRAHAVHLDPSWINFAKPDAGDDSSTRAPEFAPQAQSRREAS